MGHCVQDILKNYEQAMSYLHESDLRRNKVIQSQYKSHVIDVARILKIVPDKHVWERILKLNQQTNGGMHCETLPIDDDGQPFVIIPDTFFKENAKQMNKTLHAVTLVNKKINKCNCKVKLETEPDSPPIGKRSRSVLKKSISMYVCMYAFT